LKGDFQTGGTLSRFKRGERIERSWLKKVGRKSRKVRDQKKVFPSGKILKESADEVKGKARNAVGKTYTVDVDSFVYRKIQKRINPP